MSNGDGGFWIAVALLVIFCWGDPDIMDSIIKYLQVHAK